MRKIAVATAMLAVVGMCSLTFAQDERPNRGPGGRPADGEGRPEGRGFGQGRPDGEGGRGQFGGFRMPPNPVIVALDADKDGVISAKEIENAVAALKSLDKNNDGKLEGEEIQPPRPDFGGFGGRGGFGGGPGGPGFGGPGGPGGPGGGGRGSMAARMLQNDKNSDGKITADELEAIPADRRSDLIARFDTNKDGALDKAELEAMDQGRGGRPEGGEGRPGGDRPEGDRGGRPARPEAE